MTQDQDVTIRQVTLHDAERRLPRRKGDEKADDGTENEHYETLEGVSGLDKTKTRQKTRPKRNENETRTRREEMI